MVIYYWRNRIVAIAPVLKTGTQQWVRGFESHFLRHALVVQRIEHRFSKPRIEVRFLSRAPERKSQRVLVRLAWFDYAHHESLGGHSVLSFRGKNELAIF